MSFVHEDLEFGKLLRIVAGATGISTAFVEKDYWVAHSLWALQHRGFEIWLKGGTSLSKGFDLIKRFSEDLDLKIESGIVEGIPHVEDAEWRKDSTKAKTARRAYFEALEREIQIPGAPTERDPSIDLSDTRETKLRVLYPGQFSQDLPPSMRPHVLLEIGVARVTPNVPKDMSSFVHDNLISRSQLGDYEDNRPRAVRCVHPLVTAIEKLNIITSKYPRSDVDPSAFVRHYEDVASIVGAAASLPPLDRELGDLTDEMKRHKQIRVAPSAEHEALRPVGARRDEVLRAYEDIRSMFWGRSRIPFDDACTAIREWIVTAFPGQKTI